MTDGKESSVHRVFSWSAFGKASMEDSQYVRSVCNGFAKSNQNDSSSQQDDKTGMHSCDGARSVSVTPRSTGMFTKQTQSIPSTPRKRRSLIRNNNNHKNLLMSSQSLDSPVSKSLLNAFLQVCESQAEMNQFLRQKSIDSCRREDDDNMSAELRRLNDNSKLLRQDLERVHKPDSLPRLCSPSEHDSQDSVGSSLKSHSSHLDCKSFSSFQEFNTFISDMKNKSRLQNQQHNVASFQSKGPIQHTSSKTNQENIKKSQFENKCLNHVVCDCNESVSTNITSCYDSTSLCQNETVYRKIIFIKSPCRLGKIIEESSQGKDLVDSMTLLFFGCNEYTIQSIFVPKKSQHYTCRKRDVQGTFSVFASLFITTYGWNNDTVSISNKLLISFLLSVLFTYLLVMLPHNLPETSLSVCILGIFYIHTNSSVDIIFRKLRNI